MKKEKNTRRSPERHSAKESYRIRNWKQYNQALIQRGSLTVWMDQAVLDEWFNHERSGNRGASFTYSDKVIEAALTLKAVYRLSLRATVGLLRSLLALMGLGHGLQHLMSPPKDAIGVPATRIHG